MKRRGSPIAIVALARKILAIVHHLWTNMEPYEEPGLRRRYVTRKSMNAMSSEFRERSISSVRLKIRSVQRAADAVDYGNLIADFSIGVQPTCNLAEQGILAA